VFSSVFQILQDVHDPNTVALILAVAEKICQKHYPFLPSERFEKHKLERFSLLARYQFMIRHYLWAIVDFCRRRILAGELTQNNVEDVLRADMSNIKHDILNIANRVPKHVRGPYTIQRIVNDFGIDNVIPDLSERISMIR